MGMSLGLDRISIETGNLADGATIAAYLTSATGALITSSVAGAKVAVDAQDVADFVTNAASAAGDLGQLGLAVRHDANTTIATVDGNYAPLQLATDGSLKVSGAFSATFTAEHNEDDPFTNGDSGIFTLLVRQDTLAVSTSADGDYGAFKSNNLGELYVHDTSALAELVLIKGDTASIVTNTAAIAVSTASIDTKSTSIVTNTGNTATNTLAISNELIALSKAEDAAAVSGDLGIQALAVRKDAQGSNVSADGDYSSLQTWSEGSLKVVDIANATLLQQRVAVSGTATALPTAALANRKTIMVQNAGSASFWVGSATVTASGATSGIEVPKGGFIELECGPAVPVFAISGGGSINANVLEAA